MSRVVWRLDGFEKMDRIVRGYPSWVPAIGSALKEFITKLRNNPFGLGESRDEGYRIVIEKPLTFYIQPDPANDVVYISGVYFHGR